MGQGFAFEYHPIAENHDRYQAIYERYVKLGTFTEAEFSE